MSGGTLHSARNRSGDQSTEVQRNTSKELLTETVQYKCDTEAIRKPLDNNESHNRINRDAADLYPANWKPATQGRQW